MKPSDYSSERVVKYLWSITNSTDVASVSSTMGVIVCYNRPFTCPFTCNGDSVVCVAVDVLHKYIITCFYLLTYLLTHRLTNLLTYYLT
jgi:hypothetical protein